MKSIIAAIDITDGLHMKLKDGSIIHLPSGNAPELCYYAESDNAANSRNMVYSCLSRLAN